VRRLASSLLLTLLASARCVSLDAQQIPPECAAWDDVQETRDFLVELVTSSNPEDQAARADYRLPAVTAGGVVIVTDAQICKNAARLFYEGVEPNEQRYLVHVARVGTVYVVTEPHRRVGEWQAFDGYDSTLTQSIASFAG